jgi:DNA-binding ferritin-like protein (Dps family)
MRRDKEYEPLWKGIDRSIIECKKELKKEIDRLKKFPKQYERALIMYDKYLK